MLATRQSLLVQIRLDLRFVTFMRDPLLPLFDVMAMAVVSKLANGSRPVTGWTGRTRRLMWTGRRS